MKHSIEYSRIDFREGLVIAIGGIINHDVDSRSKGLDCLGDDFGR